MADVAITIKILDPSGVKFVNVSENDSDIVDIFFSDESQASIKMSYSDIILPLSLIFSDSTTRLKWKSAFDNDALESNETEEELFKEYDEGANLSLPIMKADAAFRIFKNISICVQNIGSDQLKSVFKEEKTASSNENFSRLLLEYSCLIHSLGTIEGILKTAEKYNYSIQITADFY